MDISPGESSGVTVGDYPRMLRGKFRRDGWDYPQMVRGLLELHDLAGEVIGVRVLTSGIEAERFSDLHERLAAVIQDCVLVRAAIEGMERETLHMRIEMAKRGFLSAIRLLRGNLMRAAEVPERV